jgi:esterase
MLFYRTYGDHPTNSLTPLLILHGLLGSSASWHSQAGLLSKKRLVITVDLRNHGKSPHISGMSYREMVADVTELLNHLQLSQVHVLGHSMGGKVAMQMSLLHPHKVNRLIVVDIAPKSYPLWHQKVFQGMLSLSVETLESRMQADERLSYWVPERLDRAFLLKNLKRRAEGGFQWQCNLSEIARNYLKIAGFIKTDSCFENKTLFIKGGKSEYIQKQDQEVIAALFPDSSIAELEKSGHLPHVEEAQKFTNMVDEFINS